MKNLIKVFTVVVAVALMSASSVFSQESFRRNYTNFTVSAPENSKVEGEYTGPNVFVFNYNKNEDVLHIRPNGNKVLYVRMSEFWRSEEGEPVYTFFEALDEFGETIIIQIFLDIDSGVVLYSQEGGREEYDTIHFYNKKK